MNQVGGLGVPDYRGARAIQVSFASDDGSGATPIRGGLAVPLLDSPTDPGMLAVLTRTPDRRFSEIDITSLENVLTVSRPTLETSLELKAPDPVPERDPLTDLYDRPAFHALLDLEIGRARGRREQMALLMLDVDRLTTINARIGHLAADDVLASMAKVLQDVAGPRDLACRIGGGRFGVVLSQADSRDAEGLFEKLQAALRERPLPNLGVVSFSGGIAELLANDDATALIVRADAALGLAEELGTRHGRDRREAARSRRRLAAASREPAIGLGLGEREERRVRGAVDDAELGQSVSLAHELALGCLLHANRPRCVRIRAALGGELAHDRGPGECGGKRREGGRVVERLDHEHAFDRTHRRPPSRPQAEHALRGGRRQGDAAASRQPARRGCHDELARDDRGERRSEAGDVAPPRPAGPIADPRSRESEARRR